MKSVYSRLVVLSWDDIQQLWFERVWAVQNKAAGVIMPISPCLSLRNLTATSAIEA
jgi:hypothetical protein